MANTIIIKIKKIKITENISYTIKKGRYFSYTIIVVYKIYMNFLIVYEILLEDKQPSPITR